MLSYQHMYHAGGLADLHKHAALSLLLSHLAGKPQPVAYVETHAGRGLYDLASAEAQKTGEAERGILRRDAAGGLPPGHPYTKAVEAVRQAHGPDAYPGSPMIARQLLRPKDRLTLMELHPKEYATLCETMQGAQNVACRRKDGFKEALSLAPVKGCAGLVFVDPSYEVKTEYETALDFVQALHHQWRNAIILLWYPILDQHYHNKLERILSRAKLPGFWQQKIYYTEEQKKRALGSGLIVVNLPVSLRMELGKIDRLVNPA